VSAAPPDGSTDAATGNSPACARSRPASSRALLFAGLGCGVLLAIDAAAALAHRDKRIEGLRW
jgi:hypothetical protein